MTFAELGIPVTIGLLVLAFIVFKFIKGLVKFIFILALLGGLAYLAWMGYGSLQDTGAELITAPILE